jgi:long-chain acyl-CoA synthetase
MRGTVAELWLRAVSAPPSTPPFLVERDGTWSEVSWVDAGRAVDELAAGFLALGVARGDRVALLARTRLEWALCDWALISIGAVVVPIYPTSSALECAYILGNSAARVVICEDGRQVEKIEPVRRDLEGLERVIVMDDPDGASTTLAVLQAKGRERLAERPRVVEGVREALSPGDLLTVVYTSGTTGPPKGCMLTHGNYRTMVESICAIEGLARPGDRTVLYLPLAHTFARLIEFLGPALGLTIAFCSEATGVPAALRDVRPTIFASVPKLYERVRSAVETSAEAPGVRGALLRWALDVGLRSSRYRQQGRRRPPLLVAQHALADRVALAKVRTRLGGRLRVAISGGAPMAREIGEFFDALGVPILEGYGLTEATTVVTVNRPGRYRLGTVGQVVPGVELRIAEDGEILVRGPTVFQGYYGDPEATRAVLDADGWLATGDVGELDADGFLTIVDRKKDLIVTAGGKKVSPQNIETALKASRSIADALVVGEGRPYLVALLVPDEEAVADIAQDEQALRELLAAEVAAVNEHRGPVEQVRRFAVLPRPLSLELSELTPTLKARRHVCEEHFAKEIEELYRGA